MSENPVSEAHRHAKASILKELSRFLIRPDKPLVLTLCRPDKRKNIEGLITACGQDDELQAMADLAVFAGIRKDISDKEENEREVLIDILLLMGRYDLYGRIAIPKKHDFEYEVPALYRVAAEKSGVFVNSAFTEPFGITLIEAAACGLPIIAPDDGGPQDIVRNCGNGLLVDTTRPDHIAAAAKQIIADQNMWKRFSQSGIANVRKKYTWRSHAAAYVKAIDKKLVKADRPHFFKARPSDAIGRRLAGLEKLLITSIGNVFNVEDKAPLNTLNTFLKQHRERIGFVVVTDGKRQSAKQAIQTRGLSPDILICSAGTEIYYGERHHYGKGWETHISARWKREEIMRLLKPLRYLTYRSEESQGPYKISYEMSPAKDRLAHIHQRLLRNRCRCNLVYDEDKYLDVLPYRASKGKAIRYISYQWEIPLANFLVCGSSMSDADMLRGETKAVVPQNAKAKLHPLKDLRYIYFAKASYAKGILEGIDHYRILN